MRRPQPLDRRAARAGAIGAGVLTGAGDDVVTADGGPEFAGPMNTVLFASGQSGNDRLVATAPAFTYVAGGTGNDTLLGNPKVRNIMFAGPGDDLLAGGRDGDDADLGPGRDQAFLKGGDDIVTSRDKARDLVGCGGGRDVASRDSRDRLVRCERRIKRPIKVGSTG